MTTMEAKDWIIVPRHINSRQYIVESTRVVCVIIQWFQKRRLKGVEIALNSRRYRILLPFSRHLHDSTDVSSVFNRWCQLKQSISCSPKSYAEKYNSFLHNLLTNWVRISWCLQQHISLVVNSTRHVDVMGSTLDYWRRATWAVGFSINQIALWLYIIDINILSWKCSLQIEKPLMAHHFFAIIILLSISTPWSHQPCRLAGWAQYQRRP